MTVLTTSGLVIEVFQVVTSQASSDADNLYPTGHSHHVSNGRWIVGRAEEEFYSERQPRDKNGRWIRYGGAGFTPGASAVAGASGYRTARASSTFAVARRDSYADVVVDPAHRAKAARAYMAMPAFDQGAVKAYQALTRDVADQYKYMTQVLGIKVKVTKEDPYANVDEMMHDINVNKTLKVMSTATTGGHPLMTNRQNDMFRAVHDFYGHAATGRDFSRHGERATYLSHASMMRSPDSIRALFTETEMQNAALIATGSFQDQKIGLADDSLVFEGLR